MIKFYSTTRRVPFGGRSANDTSFIHQPSVSLYPINWQGNQVERAMIVGPLNRAAVDLMMADPEVTGVTVFEWWDE